MWWKQLCCRTKENVLRQLANFPASYFLEPCHCRNFVLQEQMSTIKCRLYTVLFVGQDTTTENLVFLKDKDGPLWISCFEIEGYTEAGQPASNNHDIMHIYCLQFLKLCPFDKELFKKTGQVENETYVVLRFCNIFFAFPRYSNIYPAKRIDSYKSTCTYVHFYDSLYTCTICV